MEEFPNQLLENLTKQELVGVIELLHYAACAQTQEDFEVFLRVFCSVFPFKYVLGGVIMTGDVDVTYLPGWDVSRTRHRVINVSYPVAWLQEYYEKLYYQDDVVMKSILSSQFVKTWDQLYAECSTSAERAVFERARSYGLVNGVSAGYLDGESQWGAFISCAGCDKSEAIRLVPIVDYALKQIYESFVQFAQACVVFNVSGSQTFDQVQLTQRERDVIYWVSEGKTTGEIGLIMGLTKRTVKFYLSRLFGKFDVSRRAQLIAKVLSRKCSG